MTPRSRSAAVAADPLPATFSTQLATLVKAPPTGDSWLHELKYDGYRIGCRIDRGSVLLLSRNGKDWTARFPSVVEAARRLPVRQALLDGEVTIVMPDGRTSFQALQNAYGSGLREGEIVYFVFDLLHLDGTDVSRQKLEERKARLRRLLGGADTIMRYADHVVGHGTQVFDAACRQGAEGIVSKRRDLAYQPGRGPSWLKTKCVDRQEFVIGGFTDPEGSRAGIGALLIGVHDSHGQLVFAGKVGTGFTQASARELRRRLEAIEQREPPFAVRPAGRVGRDVHWVKPSLVGEVAFTEWTGDGKIRHPSFQGLREDKRPADVVRERPQLAEPQATQPPKRPRRHEQRVVRRSGRTTTRARRGAPEATVAGVRITHPDRVLYPDLPLTKLQLAEFYEGIAKWILPHLAGRPLTLVRCPEGVGPSCFYMKHAHQWAPEGLRRVAIQEKRKVGEYLVAESVTALVGLVQMGILEIHTWNSTTDNLEHPDRIVIDLDPGPRVAWPAVIDAARLVRAALEALSLQSFVKTTGGRGLHIVVPLAPRAPWDECLDFSRAVAEAVVRLDARKYTTAFAKAGRESQILIDYMRNNRTNTSVAAYSTRAKPKAPLSVPLDWDELNARLPSDHFTVRNVGKRLAGLRSDPWQAYWKIRQQIPRDAVDRLATVR